MTAPLVLLGPQRFEPTVAAVARELDLDGPIATVNAGWQEREPDDEELDELLGGGTVNLHLFGRWLDVAEHDSELVAADRQRRETLDELQAVYLLRLHRALQSLGELRARTGTPELLAAAAQDAIRSVRDLDRWHLDQVAAVHAAFEDRWTPAERPVVSRHRAEVTQVLDGAGALAIAGGHVGVLLAVLRLFGVAGANPQRPVLAWSAGAMVLTDTIVLFHDHAAHGYRHAEVFDAGLGVARGIVALPHARRRLDTEDRERMSLLARRFAPARCVVLEDGAVLRLGVTGALPEHTVIVDDEGGLGPCAA